MADTNIKILNLVKKSFSEDWSSQYSKSLPTPTRGICSFNPNSLSHPGTLTSVAFADQVIKFSRLRFGQIDSPLTSSALDSLIQWSASSSISLYLQSQSPFFFQCPHLSQLKQSLYPRLISHKLYTPLTASDVIFLHNIHVFHQMVSFLSCLPPEITI